jgi:hypothetical protein
LLITAITDFEGKKLRNDAKQIAIVVLRPESSSGLHERNLAAAVAIRRKEEKDNDEDISIFNRKLQWQEKRSRLSEAE